MRCNIPYVYLLIFLSLLIPFQIFGQLESSLIDQLAEAEWDEEKAGFDEWIEELEFLAEHKRDLNKVNEADLQDLGFLDPMEIQNILIYRQELGNFLDLHEIQAVPGIDGALADLLSIFHYIAPVHKADFTLKSFQSEESNHQLLLRWHRVLMKRKGYIASDSLAPAYQGSQGAFLIKYKFALGKSIQFGFAAEKDPGERFWNREALGLDHFGAYLLYQPENKWINSIIIGDFKANFGQGLISQGAYFGGKSSMVLQIAQSNFGFSKYSSVSENSFKRGIALEKTYGRFHFHQYFSAMRVDATLEGEIDSLETTKLKIRSLPLTGYHRSASELEKRKNTWKLSSGLAIKYRIPSQTYGINIQVERFQYPFIQSDEPYKMYSPDGPVFIHTSLDHQNRIQNFLLSGEISISHPNGWALVESCQSSVHKSLDLGLLFRYYSPRYFSMSANSFGSGNQSTNEKGLYLSAVFNPANGWKSSLYVDIWSHPWLKYLTDSPTMGYEYYAKIEYSKKRKWSSYLIYQQRSKPKNGEIGPGGIAKLTTHILEKITFHVNYKIHESVELRNRFEVRRSDQSDKAAFLMYQDFIYKPFNRRLSFTARIAIFESKHYSTRLYAYENDLLYASSIPAYDNNGTRFYINARIKVNKIWTVECRWENVYYPFENSISSGNDEIASNRKSSIKIQLRLSI
jgi:hypothetical protein